MNQETIIKREKTRLKNLLKIYRDDLITTIYSKNNGYVDITQVIRSVDRSIQVINGGL